MTRCLLHRRGLSGLAVLALAGLCACVGTSPARRPKPDHVLILVFDQMRPDYVDRFNLENFRRLRATSRHYPDAYVGHLGSQTVVSHLVIPTGLAPKDLPWQDDAMLDVDGAIGPPDTAYDTVQLTREQMWALLAKSPRRQFLPAQLEDALGGRVFAVGEKGYAAAALGGPYASSIVTLAKANGRCTPDGVNVPGYIAGNSRFTVECAETYGTGFSTIYVLDALEAQGLTERTMVVVTADHGGQKNDAYLGNNRFQSCCAFANSQARVEPPYWLDHLNQLGKLRTAYVDSSVNLWLAEHSAANEQALARGLADVSGVSEEKSS